jgi:DNA-binding PadR family transcriptional regulator
VLKKELVAASAEPLVLSLLNQADRNCYAIIQAIKQLSDDRIQWSDGMLYPVLHRLEQRGQIRSRWKLSETGRRRKYYSIRKSGRAALESMQEQWLVVHQTLMQLWRLEHVQS